PTQIDHAVDLPHQMISRHHLVEIKRVKELPLSTLSPPHHGPLPRITSQSDGIRVRTRSQQEFCNTFPPKADLPNLRTAPAARLLVASHISRLASRDAAKSLLSTLVSESSGECRVMAALASLMRHNVRFDADQGHSTAFA